MGPLQGVRVVEFEGLGPGPVAGMMLAQLGAEVTVVRRMQRAAVKAQLGGAAVDHIDRGKRGVAIDLKRPEGVELALAFVERADALIEGLRPGVMERLGLGPEVCLERNPRLVYGRMTGWGQEGPLASAAGHDLNYVALTGLLAVSGRPGELPTIRSDGDRRCRRRTGAGLRHRLRAARSAQFGAWPGRRCGDR